MNQALVLGGGVAGLCAAFRLRDAGYQVRLLEGHRWLGGRAFSVQDDRLGRVRDNGPHVIMGCYDEFRWLLRRIGTEQDFAQAKSLAMLYVTEDGQRHRLQLSRWPMPLAFPWSLLRFSGLSFGARLRALRGLVAVLGRPRSSRTLADWLRRNGQQGAPTTFLWLPLCQAIMNAEPEDVSAAAFLSCLRRAFMGAASRGAIWFPLRPWVEVIGEAAARQLANEGCEVSQPMRVNELVISDGRLQSVVAGAVRLDLREGDICVSALPWHVLSRLLPESLHSPGMQLKGSPILSIYFDCSQAVLPIADPLVCLAGGGPFHYVYQTPGDQPGRLAMIADASVELDGRSAQEVEAIARGQLRTWLGVEPPADATVRIVREANATFVAAPALPNQLRPGPLPGVANLLVCGEWTKTGLPSTLEAAALSAAMAVKGL